MLDRHSTRLQRVGLQPQKDDFVNNINSGKYELKFASPETLLQSHKEVVLRLSKRGDLKGIFINEAHCIKKLQVYLYSLIENTK